MRFYMLLATALTAAALPSSQLEDSNNLEARAASCTSSKGDPNRADIEAIVNDLQKTNPDEQVALNRRKQLTFTLGSSRICVANDFIFENTHVKRSDIGRGALKALNRCCRAGSW